MDVTAWPRITGPAVHAADPGVMRAWAADPAPFHAVVVLLHSAAVEERMRQVVRALHPWCLVGAAQPHITLVACGAVRPTAVPRGLRGEVSVAGADSFTSAAFLHASGDLLGLRSSLLDAIPEVDPAPRWVPHVTVGTYRWPVAAGQVARRLRPWRAAAELRTAGRVAVVQVDRASGRLIEAT